MMKYAVQDRFSGNRVAQVIGSIGFLDVGGKNKRFILVVAMVDDLEQQIGFFGYL